MTRQEWLKSVNVGDRVLAVSEESDAKNPGIVVDVDEDFITIFESDSRELEFYSPNDGAMAGTDWRIEPLSEWRKEPPDEEGWWACWGIFGGVSFIQFRDSNGGLRMIGDTYGTSDWRKSTQGAYWQKARVPAPPVEVENA